MSSLTSTASSVSPASEASEYLDARAEYKARCNEEWFKDAFGVPHKNNWHHEDWFRLAEHHPRLLIEAAREHSKTQIFAITQPLVEVALNPNIRILIVSDVYEKSQERTRVLREHIERNEEYQRYAPHVRVLRVRGDERLWVERENYWLKEPTITSTYAGGPISGGRFDLIIADDLVSYLGNANTPGKRQKLSRWWSDEVENSIAPGGKIWVIGTHQDPEDLYEELKRVDRYHVRVYPAVDEEDTGYGNLGYTERNVGWTEPDASVLWPAAFSYSQHMAKKDNPSTHDSYLRQQQQLAVPETGLVFRKALMDQAFERGKFVTYDEEAAQFIGLDPGYGKRAAMLCFQEKAGDRVELWAEHSFTQLPDEEIAEAVCDHAEEVNLEAYFQDAEDPGLAAKVRKERDQRGLSFTVVTVPFNKYKRLSIKATRWLLESGRLSWKADTTTVHTPGRTRTEPSIFRREVSNYALKEGTDDEPQKSDDHGPDAQTAFMSKWVKEWIKAAEEAA